MTRERAETYISRMRIVLVFACLLVACSSSTGPTVRYDGTYVTTADTIVLTTVGATNTGGSPPLKGGYTRRVVQNGVENVYLGDAFFDLPTDPAPHHIAFDDRSVSDAALVSGVLDGSTLTVQTRSATIVYTRR